MSKKLRLEELESRCTPSLYIWQNLGTDWHTLGNWRVAGQVPQQLPTINDSCEIPFAVANQPIVSTAPVTVGSIAMTGASELTLRQSLTIDNVNHVDGSLDWPATILKKIHFEGDVTLRLARFYTRGAMFTTFVTTEAHLEQHQQVDVSESTLMSADVSGGLFASIDSLRVGTPGDQFESRFFVHRFSTFEISGGACEIEVGPLGVFEIDTRYLATDGAHVRLFASSLDSSLHVAQGGQLLFGGDASHYTRFDLRVYSDGVVKLPAGALVEFGAAGDAITVYETGALLLEGSTTLRLVGSDARVLVSNGTVEIARVGAHRIASITLGALDLQGGARLTFTGFDKAELRVHHFTLSDVTVLLRAYANDDCDKITVTGDVACDDAHFVVTPMGGYDPLAGSVFDIVTWQTDWIGNGPFVTFVGKDSSSFCDDDNNRLRVTIV